MLQDIHSLLYAAKKDLLDATFGRKLRTTEVWKSFTQWKLLSCVAAAAGARGGGWWIIFEQIPHLITSSNAPPWYWWVRRQCGSRILLRLHPLPSHNYYAPPSSTVPRTTVRLLCASDAIKFETVLGEGGRTRERAYWRGGSPSLCTRLRLRDPVLLLWFSSLAICPISFPLSCTLSGRLGPFAAVRLDFVNSERLLFVLWAAAPVGVDSLWTSAKSQSLHLCLLTFEDVCVCSRD